MADTFDEWRVLVFELKTGTVLADVRPSSRPSFSRGIADKGSWSVDLQIDDPTNATLDFRAYATSSKYGWAVLYGNYVCQAGPVTSYSVDAEERTLNVSGTGIGGLFAQRVLRNPAGHTAIVDPSNDITWDGEFSWEIMRRLCLYGLVLTADDADNGVPIPGRPFYLPVNVPPQWPNQGPGNATQGTYYGYDLANIWERMVQLSERINGPEFDFVPRINGTGSQVYWDFVIGTPLMGDQASNAVWDLGGGLLRVDVDGDTSVATTTRVWSKGTGSDRGLLTGFAEDQSLYTEGYPGKDYVDGEHSSVVVQQTMEDYADAYLAAFRWPAEEWSCVVRIDGNQDGSPALGEWELGDNVTLGVQGHLWIPDGNYRKRVTKVESNSDFAVRLTIEDPEEV